MSSRARPALVLAVLVAVLATGACRKAEPPPVGLGEPTSGPLVFPPPLEGWSGRKPLPAKDGPRDPSRVRLTSPSVEDGKIEIAGDVVRLHFDDTLVGDLRSAPLLTITPAVRGRTVWPYGSSVEFHADVPLDPATEYTLSLPDITTPSGRTLSGFSVKMTSKRAIDVTGKTITYVPEAGKPRVLATQPLSDGPIGGSQEVRVVLDQPIDAALATSRITLEDGEGKLVPSSIALSTATRFEDQPIEPRRLVVVRPLARQKPGDKLVLRVKAMHDGAEETVRTYTVAEPTRVERVACPDRGRCEIQGTSVLGSVDAEVRVTLSNPAPALMDTKNVRATPAVKNLVAWGWDRELTIAGSFAPSTRYTFTVGGGVDSYGGAVAPFTVTLETRPLPGSLTIPEGPLLATPEILRAVPVTARNVTRGELALWALPVGDTNAFATALRDARAGAVPSRSPDAVVPLTPSTPRDATRDLDVDLSGHVELGRVYVARVAAKEVVPKALRPEEAVGRYEHPTEGAPTATATVLVTAKPDAVGAHVHHVGGKALVQVFAQGTGEPTAGAKVTIGAASATTDATGTAVLAAPAAQPGDDAVAKVEVGGGTTLVPFGASHATFSRALFPELSRVANDDEPLADDLVGMIVTDRGVYRPGSKIALKGFVRRVEADGLRPAGSTKVRLHVTDGEDQLVLDDLVETNGRGTFARDVPLEKNARTGRWRLRIELDGTQRRLVADETVRVATYVPPRFKVDVEPDANAPSGRTRAKIAGRYLFGATMSGARVTWSLRKSPTSVPSGPFESAGLAFADEPYWDSRDAADDKPIVGEGVLDAEGNLVVDVAHGDLSARQPTEITLEADVTDASHRHVVGSAHVVRHAAAHYAGLRLGRRFGAPGPLRVELGAVDPKGAPAAGVKVGARLERLTWTRTAEKAESGAIVEGWRHVATPVSTCEVSSTTSPTACELVVPRNGSYQVVTQIDGHDGARAHYYAWGGAGDDGDTATPSSGKKVPVLLDKAKYEAGETAKVLVQSPFPRATALLSVEQGGLVRHATKAVENGAASFDLPLTGANAPWVHAVVTLLPVGGTEPDYRVGVVRVPVSDAGTKLDVTVASAKPSYEVRDQADISVVVKRKGAPVKNADVTLAVVDEGVLRLTNHHAKDPNVALRVGRDLAFRAADTRAWMLRRRERAHVAGGGDERDDESGIRRDFAETVAFLTNLTTDGEGRVTAKVKLPDNVTEFRMMAVAVDEVGGGGRAESSFLVTKPILLDPVMPRFALRGDRFDAAAIVHNTTDAPVQAKVTIAGQVRDVSVPAKGRARVDVPMEAKELGEKRLRFALAAAGKTRDDVELPFRVEAPGVDEHPRLSGVLVDKQEITIEIPEDAMFEHDAVLSVKTGSALYPELGHRLRFLLDYPHGCLEQTTSSLIPLVAARTLLPWTGTAPLSDDELDRRIRAGVDRIATMATPSGGLSYWPGSYEPNDFGTAYALRALVLAREAGVDRTKLIDGMATYLVGQLDNVSPDLRVTVAEALAIAGKLPESSADALWDLRGKLDVFGKASLALALTHLPRQEDRVRELTDAVVAEFDDKGTPKKKHGDEAAFWWPSYDRDRAQALLLLTRVRREAPLTTTLAERLARSIDGYTTQTTAWSLLALASHIGDKTPKGGVDVRLRLQGVLLDTTRKLGGDNKEVQIPLRELAGKRSVLVLQGDGKTRSAFALEASYRRPLDRSDGRVARRAPKGPSIHRSYTSSDGKPLDLAKVKAGQIVRVAVRLELPAGDSSRRAFVALSDHLPAGFEPVPPDLGTVSRVDELGPEHPLQDWLSGWYGDPSHVDLRDDRVSVYFDHPYSNVLFATYLARATTPGTFALAPAHAELMYEPDSDGYSDAGKVVVLP